MRVGEVSASMELVEVRSAPALRDLGVSEPGAPALARSLLRDNGAALATLAELAESERWLTATLGSAQRLPHRLRQLRARWRFPAFPLIAIDLDGEEVATATYLEQSSSAHWAVTVTTPPTTPLALVPLAGRVPEEIDADPGLRVYALEVALGAVAQRLVQRRVASR